MKTKTLLLLSFLISFSSQAASANFTQDRNINALKPIEIGDTVLYGNVDYVVAAINEDRSSHYYKLRYANNDSIHSSWFSKSQLGITSGCYDSICVGDKVIYGNVDYVVAAINEEGSRGYYKLRYANNDSIHSSWFSKSQLALVTPNPARVQAEKDENELKDLINKGIIDEVVYRSLRNAGATHVEAIDKASGPIFVSLERSGKFLQKLSEHVYSFDKAYVLKVKNITTDNNKNNLFVLNALLPYLKNSGYKSIKEKYLDSSVKRIEEISSEKRIFSLRDIESTSHARALAAQMLAASLSTSIPQMSAGQKSKTQNMLQILSTILAKNMRYQDMMLFFQHAGEMESLILELSQNPYLQSRSATDMLLLEYLKNS